LVAVLLPGSLLAEDAAKPKDGDHMHHVAPPDSPEWKKLTSLVGQWEGTTEEGGKKLPTQVEIRMTGGGSAVMHVAGKDTPHEMVTMFHPDGKELLATHYCAARNQPRLKLSPAKAANQLAFTFKDGTNIGPTDGHMSGLVITVLDADHHTETWTYTDGGKETSSVFTYARKK
jgi:hypothetical protein